MLNDYLTWWAAQMLGWLPAHVGEHGRGAPNAVVVELLTHPVGEGVEITLRRRRQDRKLGRFDLGLSGLRTLQAAVPARGRPREIVLRLPPNLLLEREVVFPLAAEREPEKVLDYEMGRITPFASTEVFWTYAIDHRDRAQGRLHLRLSLVTRTAIQKLLTSLTQVGLGPTFLEVRNGDGTLRRIALCRPDARQIRLARRSLTAAAAACAALVLTAGALPFILQSVAETRIEARIKTLRPLVSEAEILRHRIATSTDGVDIIEAERIHLGDTLAVLAALTALLPDDTYLTDFTLRQGKLALNGQSAAAVRLIAALSGSPVIQNPEFVAPVTRFDNRADLFAIRAEISR